MDVQWQIKQNVSEANEYLKDLKSWSSNKKHSVARKNKKNKQNENANKNNNMDDKGAGSAGGGEDEVMRNYVPPVRGRVEGPVTRLGQEFSKPTNALLNKKSERRRKKKKKKTSLEKKEEEKVQRERMNAAGHTYDYFRDKWDKFDVDEALREASESGSSYETEEEEVEEEPGTVTELMGQAKEPPQRRAPIQRVSNQLTAEQYKTKGNEYYSGGQYLRAVECYTMSVDQERTAVAFANRAMALLKLGEHERAEEDATSALEIDPSYLKALQRRSTARREQGKLLEAMEDCESALRLTPQSQALRGDRRALAKAYRDAEGLEPLKTEATVTIAKDARAAQKTKERGEEVEPEEDAGPPAAARSEARPAAAVAAASPPSRPLPVPKARASPSAPPTRAPRTSAEFEVAWRSLRADDGGRWALLSSLDPLAISGLLKDSLTGEVFYSILTCILGNMSGENGLGAGVAILRSLSQTPRFKINVLSIPSRKRAELKSLWEARLAEMGGGGGDAEALAALAEVYGATK